MDKDTIIQQLQANKEALKEAGLEHLYLFGSVARGDNDEFSDVDLAGTFDPIKVPTPLERGSAICEIAEILGTEEFDLADETILKPEIRERFNQDKLRVF